MPVEIIKVYHGTNIIKVRRKSGQVKYGYRITVDGVKYQPADWNTKGDAETALDNFKRRLRDPNFNPYDYREPTLDDLKAAWAARAARRNLSPRRIHEMGVVIDRFKKVAHTDRLRHLTEDDLLDYQGSRLSGKKPKHNHTINKEMAMLRTCFRAANKLFPGLRWEPPALDLKDRLPEVHKGREVVLAPEQMRAILAELASPSNVKGENERRLLTHDAVIVAIEQIRRISEIAMLTRSQVSFQRGIGARYGRISLRSAKTGRWQSVSMTKTTAEVLRRRMEQAGGEHLFVGNYKSPGRAAVGIRRSFMRACERAGIKYGLNNDGAVFHTIRHSSTTHLVNKRVPLPTIMSFTGHSKRTMLLRYSHATAETVDEAIELLDEIVQPESTNNQQKQRRT